MNKFLEVKEEMKVEFKEAIAALVKANNVDEGVALDMLIANEERGGQYAYVHKEKFAELNKKLNDAANEAVNPDDSQE